MKLGHLIEYDYKNIFFFKNHTKRRGRETSSRTLFVFLKKLYIR